MAEYDVRCCLELRKGTKVCLNSRKDGQRSGGFAVDQLHVGPRTCCGLAAHDRGIGGQYELVRGL